MPLDDIVRSAVSRLGVVRVGNAPNPLPYMALVVILASWGCALLFRDGPILKYGLVVFGGVFAEEGPIRKPDGFSRRTEGEES